MMRPRVERLGAGDLATLWAEEPATPFHIGLAGLLEPGRLVDGRGRSGGPCSGTSTAPTAPTRTWSTRATAGRRSGSSRWTRRVPSATMHIDVWVPHDQAEARVAAAIAAGGRLVTDEHAPMWWVLADPEGNEVDVATWMSRD
jgi:Glyoxalase-like domain